MTRATFIPGLCLALAASAAASMQPAPPSADFSGAKVMHVDLSNFSFAPRVIHLKAGQPVMLHLVGSGSHAFTAPEFFAAATVRPEDLHLIEGGRVEVPAGGEAAVVLIPAAGTYKLKCGHGMHKALGMSGEIIVTW